jgi:hypothetical protein
MTWNDHVEETQDIQNSKEHKDQGSKEERNSPEQNTDFTYIQVGTGLQKDFGANWINKH